MARSGGSLEVAATREGDGMTRAPAPLTPPTPTTSPVTLHDLLDARRRLRALTAQLVEEYAHLLPPGQVVAAVTRARRAVGTRDDPLLDRCEAVARDQLTAQLAGVRPPRPRRVSPR